MLKQLSNLKVFISDVDGVMTDARVWLDSNRNWRRCFSVYDGVGVKRLQQAGIAVGIITAAHAEDVRERFSFLEVDYFFENIKDKMGPLEEIKNKSGFSFHEMAYIGDDLMDLPLIEKVGFGITVPHALSQIKEKAKYVTKNAGGFGAVREVCELILESRRV